MNADPETIKGKVCQCGQPAVGYDDGWYCAACYGRRRRPARYRAEKIGNRVAELWQGTEKIATFWGTDALENARLSAVLLNADAWRRRDAISIDDDSDVDRSRVGQVARTKDALTFL